MDRPADLEQARTVTQAFVQHYNVERPHQGLSCGNRPPRSAFPHLPAFPPLPSIVDPDRWLTELDGLHVERKVDQHGMVSLDLKRNSVSAKLVGHHVVLQFPRVVQDGDLVAHPVGSWMPKHAVCRSCMNNRSSKRCPSEQWWDTSSPLSRFSPICCTRLALRPACAPCKNARTARRLSPLPSSTMC